MGSGEIKVKKLFTPQGIIGILNAIIALIGSIILWSRPKDGFYKVFDILFSDGQITLVFLITLVALLALVLRRPLLFAFNFGVIVAAAGNWVYLADHFHRLPDPTESFTYRSKFVAGFGLGALSLLVGFVVVRAKLKKMKAWKIAAAIISIFDLIGCALLWRGYHEIDLFDPSSIAQQVLNWGMIFLFIGLFFLASLFVKWKPARPITMFLTGWAVSIFQNLHSQSLNKNSEAGLYITAISGLLIFLLIVVIKTGGGRFHPGKLFKKVKTIRCLLLVLAFIAVMVGDSLYWSYLKDFEADTFQIKYVLAMFLLVVIANFIGHLLKQHLIFIAALGVVYFNLATLLELTKAQYAGDGGPEKARAATVLIWIGLGLSFVVAPVKRKKHLEPNSPRVILGAILTIALIVVGIVIATSKAVLFIHNGSVSILVFFFAILFTVAWTTKPDLTQVITSFLGGVIIYTYILIYHIYHTYSDLFTISDQPKAGLILGIIFMAVAVAFLNIPIFTRYKKKDKKKDKERRRDREDAPLVT